MQECVIVAAYPKIREWSVMFSTTLSLINCKSGSVDHNSCNEMRLRVVGAGAGRRGACVEAYSVYCLLPTRLVELSFQFLCSAPTAAAQAGAVTPAQIPVLLCSAASQHLAV